MLRLFDSRHIKHFAFQTLPSALTAELHSAYACGAASHADAWLAEHFQKQNALKYVAVSLGKPLEKIDFFAGHGRYLQGSATTGILLLVSRLIAPWALRMLS
ncbi:hypothetical protein [Desulfocurvibacter africanus]|uniref:hypothetical protein n=1 Tax=Desulfocurvibacter africanus TaxID=873 RepID=UPI0004176AF7|nr:hypothetical protein [Desulfocurvibacter africanus]